MPAKKKPIAPPPVSAEPSGVYIKVPMSPELAAAVGGHFERGRKLSDMLIGLFEGALAFSEAVALERAEIDRTAARLRRGARRRRK